MAIVFSEGSSLDWECDMSEEEDLIIRMYKLIDNKWSLIAGRIPGRKAKEIERYWAMRTQQLCGGDDAILASVCACQVYENEWPLIEAESYRVLVDAVFESREEQFESGEEQVEHKRREGKRQGKRTVEEFDDDYGDTESEYECENEFVAPLTRARNALVNKPKNEEIVDVEEGFHGGNGVSIEEEAAEAPSSPPRRSSRHRIGSFASSVSSSASASGQRVSSRLQNENEIEGRGKRIACENEIEIEGRGKRITCENEITGRGKRVACEPPPLVLLPATSVLKKPKIEVIEDLEKYNYGGCFGTPIVEEIDESSKGFDDCQTSGELKKPEIERDGCTFPFPVMNVVPITAVNACPEPSSDQNEKKIRRRGRGIRYHAFQPQAHPFQCCSGKQQAVSSPPSDRLFLLHQARLL